MASKSFEIDNVGTVHVYKRRGTKSLRLSIASDGKIRVTMPAWASYTSGLEFVQSRVEWIVRNKPASEGLLVPGQAIGKAHRLIFSRSAEKEIRTRIAGSEVRIILPEKIHFSSPESQKAARRASVRALRTEAEKLLPVRLKQLALKHQFEYSKVQVKQLKGRWGSCDTQKNIILNLYLMQLPWHLIDYVLIHELIHTVHLNHSASFWSAFLIAEPRAKEYRRQIRTHKPVLETVEQEPVM